MAKELPRNFCMAPWIQLRLLANGDAYPCCVAKQYPENRVGNSNKESLNGILNSEKSKEIRLHFLADKPLPPMCVKCKQTEESGGSSFRNYVNEFYRDRYDDLVYDVTNDDGSLESLKLLRWDFRFSNKCNMACVTCHPSASTLWHKDFVKIHGKEAAPFPVLQQLDQDSSFFKDVYQQLDFVEEIRFAGGEPLIMEEHWRMIKVLHEKKRFDTNLVYSTNGTRLTYKGEQIFDYWRDFNNVSAVLSIDGVGDHFEYIRYGGKWDEVRKNLIDISEADIINYSISSVVSILNIFHLPDLHRELSAMGMMTLPENNKKWRMFRFGFCFDPIRYNIKTLPIELKKLAEDNIRRYINDNTNTPNFDVSIWESVITFMYAEDLSDQFPTFVERIKQLDQIRRNDFLKLEPIFYKYF